MPAIRRCVLLCLVLAACRQPAGSGGDRSAADSGVAAWDFEPGVRFGALGPASSESDLTAAYGAGNVRPADVPLGEGETVPGTEVFGETPVRRFLVTWKDTLGRRSPDQVQLAGDSTVWQGPLGITLGLSLRRLEQLNGRPFSLFGFGWDYGGTVATWEGGALAPWEGRLLVTLMPHPDSYSSAAYRSVLGDRPFPSSLAAMQGLDPHAARLVVRFP